MEVTVGGVVGENLRRIRGLRNLSQSDVARMLTKHGLDRDRVQVSALETGRRESITIDELLIMSWTLDVRLSEWFEGEGDVQFNGWRTDDRERIRKTLSGKRVTDGSMVYVDTTEALEGNYHVDDSIAERLGIGFDEEIEIAKSIWKRSATEERDARLSEHAGKTPKELRTLRSGMTKRLLREIREHLEGGD